MFPDWADGSTKSVFFQKKLYNLEKKPDTWCIRHGAYWRIATPFDHGGRYSVPSTGTVFPSDRKQANDFFRRGRDTLIQRRPDHGFRGHVGL